MIRIVSSQTAIYSQVKTDFENAFSQCDDVTGCVTPEVVHRHYVQPARAAPKTPNKNLKDREALLARNHLFGNGGRNLSDWRLSLHQLRFHCSCCSIKDTFLHSLNGVNHTGQNAHKILSGKIYNDYIFLLFVNVCLLSRMVMIFFSTTCKKHSALFSKRTPFSFEVDGSRDPACHLKRAYKCVPTL